jgi:hypothetical protein
VSAAQRTGSVPEVRTPSMTVNEHLHQLVDELDERAAGREAH